MQIKLFFLAILSTVVLTACTDEIDIKLDSMTPELVVDGSISTDTTAHIVYLRKTGDYFCNQPSDIVSGATVNLNDGFSTIALTEDETKKGCYKTPSDYYGVAGRTYTLTISNVDVNTDGVKELYTASSTLNAVSTVKQISVKKEILYYENVWAVDVWMHDQAGVANYYLTRAYKNNICISDTISEWNITDDKLFDGADLNDKPMMYLPSDKKTEKIYVGDLVTLEVCGISKDYYDFIAEVKEEYAGHNPLFGGQPSNIRTNVKQIYPIEKSSSPRGYFAAYAISRAQTVYK